MRTEKRIFIILILLLLLVACVSTQKELPTWAEIKPPNTSREIFFVYGPTNSRETAKAGLYKEISEYFGIKVSSVDKFVKNVNFADGVTDVNQSKNSTVDVTSREKGLDSIEIREIWNDDTTSRWCILASIDAKAEKEIREQVEKEIEAERVAAVIELGKKYTLDADDLYSNFQNEITELNRLEIRMRQSVEKISGMASALEIMDESKIGLNLGDKSTAVFKNIKGYSNDIKLLYKKNDLLKEQIEDHEIPLIELDFFIVESYDIFTKTEDKTADIERLKIDIEALNEELNRLYLKSELEVLGDEESQKKRLEILSSRILDGSSSIFKIRDESELLFTQCADILREIKQLSINKSISEDDRNSQIDKHITELDSKFELSKDNIDNSHEIKSSMGIDSQEAEKSSFITKESKRDMYKLTDGINSPVSWIEIYKDKIASIINSSNSIVDDLRVKNLIDIRLDSFTTNLINKTDSNIDLTIGEFTIEDSNISSEFSNYLKGKLFSTIANRGSVHIIDYNSVTDFLTTKNINPNVLYSGTEAADALVKNVVYGVYWLKNDEVELTISLKEIKSNRVLYSENFKLPKKSLPLGISLKPNNYNRIVDLNKKLSGVNSIKGFEVWPDRGNGSTYKDGDNMVINVVTPVPGYVKIYHISADNELTLVFPNKFDKNNRLDAGISYKIADSSYPFKFALGKPYGTESLRAVFSLNQFPDLVNDSYGDSFLYSGVRGINIEERINSDLDSNSVVATSYYTITE